MPARRSFVAVAAALAALLAAPPAGAAEPGAAAGPAPQAAAPDRPAIRPVRLVLQVGRDFGSDDLVTTSGGGRTLTANGGGFFSGGVAFLPLLDGRLHTQATIGVKYDVLRADNGDAWYVAFPVEILEFLTLEPFRVGVGVNVHLFGRVGIDTEVEQTADLDPAVGFVAQAELVWRFRGASRGALTLGPRVVLQRIGVEGGGTADANAIGGVLGFTF